MAAISMKDAQNKAMSALAAAALLIGIASLPFALAQDQPQQPTSTTTTTTTGTQPNPTQPNVIVVQQPPNNQQPSGGLIDSQLANIILAILAAIGGIVAFFKDRENVKHIRDKEFQAAAMKDVITLVADAYALNADGSVTPQEYNAFMETKVKPMAMKYGDQFGIAEYIQRILDSFQPPGPTEPSSNAANVSTNVQEKKAMERTAEREGSP